jgi:hypothetical protein
VRAPLTGVGPGAQSQFAPQIGRMLQVGDSATCLCGMAVETAQHFLFECPNWTQDREQLRVAIGERWADLSYALGGWSGRRSRITDAEVDGPRHTWKPNIQVIKAVIKFVKSTPRFHPKALVNRKGMAKDSRGWSMATTVRLDLLCLTTGATANTEELWLAYSLSREKLT